MEKNQINIDQLIKAKFDDFAPAPPEHVWRGIEKRISSKPAFFAAYGRYIAAAVVLLGLLLLGVWYFSSRSAEAPVNKLQISDSVPVKTSDDPATISDPSETKESATLISRPGEINDVPSDKHENEITLVKSPSEEATVNSATETPVATISETPVKTKALSSGETTSAAIVDIKKEPETNTTLSLNNEDIIFSIPSLSLAFNNTLFPKENVPHSSGFTQTIAVQSNPKSNGLWSTGLYFTPEMYFENYDSLKTLPSYTLSVEPTYYINKHLFVRFGLGFTYGHDRGYTRINYSGKNVLGTYEDVYDVTFDSVDGQLVATYYTKTVEVWDTTNLVTVKEPTNTYFYIQTPLMLGYYHRSNHINWYFYGGPSFNYMVSKNIAKPTEDIDYIELLDIDNHLPQRSDYYIQLWLGAGIELKASDRISLSLEPNYRLTLNNLYQERSYKKALSGFTMRFGLVYYFK